MEAGTALIGRRILAALVAALLVVSVMFLLAEPRALADHIPDTGPLPDNCVNFQAGDTGTESPPDYPSVEITLDSWTNTPGDPHTVNFTISGLAADEHVDISVKSGTTEQEVGPYGNGSHTYSNGLQNGMSHIRLCVFEDDSLALRLVKEWDGDEIDLETVDLILLIDDTPIEPLAEVQVQDGAVHEIREVVTGLPENCTYTSDPETPFNYTVDAEDAVDGLITLTITNTVECDTTTTVPEPTTTTTVPATTTTTVPATTTTEEVLGTTITAAPSTTTTVEDEVMGTEVLPFTGGSNDMLALLAGGLGLLGTLVLVSTRRMDEN